VRHAEKADNSTDPVLSTAGLARANALKDSLSSKNINAIFVTNYKRTQQTAAPLADNLGKAPIVIEASSTAALIKALQNIDDDSKVLIVGHSNTVPMIIDSLMKSPQQINIGENDFDNFYIVSVKHALSVKRKLQSKTYGIKSP
jgi:broad specificity phosphatase PhoE